MVVGTPQSAGFQIQKPSDQSQPPLNFGSPSGISLAQSLSQAPRFYQIDWLKRESGLSIVTLNYGSIITVQCDLSKTPVIFKPKINRLECW